MLSTSSGQSRNIKWEKNVCKRGGVDVPRDIPWSLYGTHYSSQVPFSMLGPSGNIKWEIIWKREGGTHQEIQSILHLALQDNFWRMSSSCEHWEQPFINILGLWLRFSHRYDLCKLERIGWSNLSLHSHTKGKGWKVVKGGSKGGREEVNDLEGLRGHRPQDEGPRRHILNMDQWGTHWDAWGGQRPSNWRRRDTGMVRNTRWGGWPWPHWDFNCLICGKILVWWNRWDEMESSPQALNRLDKRWTQMTGLDQRWEVQWPQTCCEGQAKLAY